MGCLPTAAPIWLRNRLWALLAKAPLLAAKGEATLWPKALCCPMGTLGLYFYWVLLRRSADAFHKPLLTELCLQTTTPPPWSPSLMEPTMRSGLL